jgi:hypothetical protein
MSTIDKLVSANRDPLEALIVPPAKDVAQWLKEDENEKLDKKISRELATWSSEMRARLIELINQHNITQPPIQLEIIKENKDAQDQH